MEAARYTKGIAIAAIASTIGVAIYYEFAHCGADPLRAAMIGLTLVIPGLIFWLGSNYWGTVVACAAMVVPAVWAYRVECVLPYSGGGAAMAFLAVVFYGAPSALVFGAIVGRLLKGRHAG